MDSRKKVLPESVTRMLSDDLINIAPLGTAFQSSTYSDYVVSYGIDRNTTSKWAHTNDDNG